MPAQKVVSVLEANPTDKTLGAVPSQNGVNFRLWAPKMKTVEVIADTIGGIVTLPLSRAAGGYFEGYSYVIRPGDLYYYRLDGQRCIPDPASRHQPQDVHGPSQVVDLSKFPWTDNDWKGISPTEAVIYEIHVGTFSPEGTFEGIRRRLPYLKDLGVTVLEIMPVSEFPGKRNWGYDGVLPYAPEQTYGRPEDLQRLVNAAHDIGLAVILDVVYNHLGPDGNVLHNLSDHYASAEHHTPWGQGFNFDGPSSGPVREFFIQNALYWLENYHFDGLRLDATHAIMDDGPRHVLAELADRCRGAIPQRELLLTAENERRDKKILLSPSRGGWGLDAVWADDFHHHMRRRLAGDHEGYYAHFTGSTTDIAMTLRNGWSLPAHAAQISDVKSHQFVFCIQNHDQVGNRPFGDRLNHQIDAAAFRVAHTLLLLSPHTPLLFMGQEWAASSPFLYFTDHNADLGEKVVAGRREEFKAFQQFSDPALRETIPSPQAEETFLKSRLKWDEVDKPGHVHIKNLVKALLRLRRRQPALLSTERRFYTVEALEPSLIIMRREHPVFPSIRVIANLEGEVELTLPQTDISSWQLILSTEDGSYCADPTPPAISQDSQGNTHITFKRPGALVYKT